MQPEPLSALILRENADELGRMVNHRFVQDIAAGQLPRDVFDRYLAIEGAFVETAIRIFGYAVAKAETMSDRRRLIASLDALANEQIPYFERAFAQRGISPDPLLYDDPRFVAFNDGMLDIAREGSFADIITSMFSAEWMYWTWSSRVRTAPFPDPMLQDWVEMHAVPEFAEQAQWLRARVDALGETMEAEERERAVSIFGRVQSLEIPFHSVAYG